MVGYIEANLLKRAFNGYADGLVASSVDRGEVHIEGVLVEGVLVHLSELTAHRAADIIEEHHHIALAVDHTVHVLLGEDDLCESNRQAQQCGSAG